MQGRSRCEFCKYYIESFEERIPDTTVARTMVKCKVLGIVEALSSSATSEACKHFEASNQTWVLSLKTWRWRKK